ncbi:hypothetical protein AQI88_20540 [Streptomyces cellostaticus]|uniref:Uncharacterized protein n=1 Tax=Streptomyces cellostaticus TaxID=67285 RepID=A0A124HCJ2_9ACTN|nr:hypothetical protein [Streptomyces cellostaticus]KUM94581.1 hypothetical protein AQI88_20540 [Streptomyces cellostaticus]GHI07406.1 hypothetical protein Scel_57270 [Streptomyces cellostaticus]
MNAGSAGGHSDPANVFNIGWRDPDSLRVLCRVAGEAGFLDGVEVLSLATSPTERELLLTVAVTEDLVLASTRFTWSEVEPPDGMAGIEAAHHVLGRLAEIARRARAGLSAYTWLRVASELQQVRVLLQQACTD